MLVNEVINRKHSWDILKNPNIVKLDAAFDLLQQLTADFYVPAEYLPGYCQLEYREKISRLSKELLVGPRLSRVWKKKLEILKNYFDIID